MQPVVFYGVGMVSVLLSKSGKRLGDMAAGTIVVKEDLVRRPVIAEPAPAGSPGIGQPPRLHAALSAAEFELLERFSQRQRDLDPRAARAARGPARGAARAGARGIHRRDAGGPARKLVQRRARRARRGVGLPPGHRCRARAARDRRARVEAVGGIRREARRGTAQGAEGTRRGRRSRVRRPSIAISRPISRGSGPRRREATWTRCSTSTGSSRARTT